MKNLSFTILSILIIQTITFYTLCAQEKEKGKLAEFEEEIKGNAEKEEKSNYLHGNNNDENPFNCIISNLLFNYQDVSEENSEYEDYNTYNVNDEYYDQYFHNKNTGYNDYPYCRADTGLFNRNSEKWFSIINEINYFYENKNMNGFNFKSKLSPYPSCFFEILYSDLSETLKTRYDHLRLFDVFINYNLIKHEHISLWLGLGCKGIQGDKTYTGFAYNTGLAIYSLKPISFNLNYNYGSITGTDVSQISAKLNYHIYRFKIILGYQNYKAGKVSINGWTLGFGIYL